MATLTAPAFYGEAAKPRQRLSFVIAASSCGTLIEWYDFYLYGVLAGFFGTHFFPGDMKQGFLYSLGIFWTGFVVRPFGAVIFGHLGDLIGRKYTFMLTLGMMGLSTFLVGCLPTYDQVGWLAPALLIACRRRLSRTDTPR
jgi:MFS family permease